MIKRNKLVFPSLFLIPVIAGIVALDLAGVFNRTDVPFLFAFTIYVAFTVVQKSKSSMTFGIALVLLVYMALSYVPTGASVITERFGEWFYLFFIFGLIQYIHEVIKNKNS